MKAREVWVVESSQGNVERVKFSFEAAENERIGSSSERVTRYVPEEDLRDMFAACALQGELSSETVEWRMRDRTDVVAMPDGGTTKTVVTETREQRMAANAYRFADAMIAARSAVKQST